MLFQRKVLSLHIKIKPMSERTQEDYYRESKRIRDEVLQHAKDIRGYLAKATYLGWRPVAEDKHFESAYFAYFQS